MARRRERPLVESIPPIEALLDAGPTVTITPKDAKTCKKEFSLRLEGGRRKSLGGLA